MKKIIPLDCEEKRARLIADREKTQITMPVKRLQNLSDGSFIDRIPDDIVFKNLQGMDDVCPLFEDERKGLFYCGETLLLSAGKIASVRVSPREWLHLIITGVKIKRLHDLTLQEAINEGVFLRNLEDLIENDMIDPAKTLSCDRSFDAVEIAVKNSFIELWGENRKSQFGWEKNPFVVICDFAILSPDSHYLAAS